MTQGYVGDGETMPKTPYEALDLISGFVDGSGDSKDDRPDLDEAFDLLTRFIKTWSGHECDEEDLEWGEPGDCFDRLENDTDYETDAEFMKLRDAAYALDQWGQPPLPSRETQDALEAYAKEHDYGRHYGQPHCIYCLQGW